MKALSRRFKGMGSPCQVYLLGDDEELLTDVANLATSEVERLEQKYSRYRADSLLSQINRRAGLGRWTNIDDETYRLLRYADQAFGLSDGLFDITSGVLRKIWGFNCSSLPPAKLIDRYRQRVGWQRVDWNVSAICLPVEGMQIDFGGYVKEYAADAVASLCRTQGIRHGYIDLGGDIATVGPPPNREHWRIGIRHPRSRDRAIATINLGGNALATSGDYERCMIIDGVRYSHLLNPKTARPIEARRCFASVSVVAAEALVAGTIATVAMLKGVDAGTDWLEQSQLPYLAVLQDMSLRQNELAAVV